MKIRTKYSSRNHESGMDHVKEVSKSASSSEIFAGVPNYAINKIVSQADTLEFLPGDVIHSEDDTTKQVLLLLAGRFKKSQFSVGGQEVILRLGVPGEVIFGPLLLPRTKHSSTVVALEYCKVLAWDADRFNRMVERFPVLLKNAETILESRLTDLTQRFCEVSTRTTSPRLASELVDLVDRLGERVGNHIELRVSQETLGQMTGMTVNSVWRLLSVWKSRGIVKMRRGIVEIHNVPRLLNDAESIDASAQNAEL